MSSSRLIGIRAGFCALFYGMAVGLFVLAVVHNQKWDSYPLPAFFWGAGSVDLGLVVHGWLALRPGEPRR